MKTKKKFGEKIRIKWTDAWSNPDWVSFEDACKVPSEVYCNTIGFFVCENKDFVHVASTIGKTKKNSIGGLWLIPKKWITKIS